MRKKIVEQTLLSSLWIISLILILTPVARCQNYRQSYPYPNQQLYQTSRFPRTFKSNAFYQMPYHVLWLKNARSPFGYGQSNYEIRKRTMAASAKWHKYVDPLDSNRRKYFIKSSISKNTVRKNLLYAKPRKTTINFPKISYAKKFPNNVNKKTTKTVDPMDLNHKKYFVGPVKQETGSRKNEIINDKYYFRQMNNDYFPFVGAKKDSLKVRPKTPKTVHTKSNSFLQNKMLVDGNDKEIVYSARNTDVTKPVEFYLTENNGEVKLTRGKEAAKLLDENRLMQPMDDLNSLRQEKFRDQDRNDYVNQVLGHRTENEEKPSSSVYPPMLDSRNREGSYAANHPQVSVVHEPTEPEEPPISHAPGFTANQQPAAPISEEFRRPATVRGKFLDRLPEVTTYTGPRWPNQQENQELLTNEQSVAQKLQNFHRLMDKLHRTVVNENRQEQNDVPDNSRIPELANTDLQQHGFLPDQQEERYPPPMSHAPYQDQQSHGNEFPLENMHAFKEQDRQTNGYDSREGEQAERGDANRYQTAFSLTKAIINSAKAVDAPAFPGAYGNINGQNLVPEVFEAFSRTNNDLRQRYDALQRWALTRSTRAPAEELRQKIQTLNELSDMVKLVNNLEKDMLKSILKRRRYDDQGMSYKHEVIPNGKEEKRLRNPSDVHDLLQYIYDTYIENRTADEIPVVLQAFQKSVNDIVAKKNMTKNSSLTETYDAQGNTVKSTSAYHSTPDLVNQSQKSVMTNDRQQSYNNEDDSLSNFDFDEHPSRESIFRGRFQTLNFATKSDVGRKDEKLAQFVDMENKKNSPVITVKLLKALDLFLDSIEIGRKIKTFRTKVEDIEHRKGGPILLTSGMRHSLGELNKEINQTLSRSEQFGDEKNTSFALFNSALANQSQNFAALNKTMTEDPDSRSAETYKEKLDQLKKVLDGDMSNEYNGKPYDENGIYYEKHKNEPSYEVDKWYHHNATGKWKEYIKSVPFNVTNNHTLNSVVYMHPHSPYNHPDIVKEEMNHDYDHGSFSADNITKLNKEAMKGVEAINKSVDYNKLTKEHEFNDSHSSWNADKIEALDKEAEKGQQMLHEKFSNGTDQFDKEVQKIIDGAINEARNGSSMDSFYYQHEGDSHDHFGDLKVGRAESPKYEMHSMAKAFDNGMQNVNDLLSKHKIDTETANLTRKYIDQENQLITNMFYEENHSLRGNKMTNRSFPQQREEGALESSKVIEDGRKSTNLIQDQTNIGSYSGVVQGDWDKRDMDLHNNTLDESDTSELERLKGMVKHLQEENAELEHSHNNTVLLKTNDHAEVSKHPDQKISQNNSTVSSVEIQNGRPDSNSKQVNEGIKKMEKDFFIKEKPKTVVDNAENEHKEEVNNTAPEHVNTVSAQLKDGGSKKIGDAEEALLMHDVNGKEQYGNKKNVTSGLYVNDENDANERRNELEDEAYKSEENDYLIKEEEQKTVQMRKNDAESNYIGLPRNEAELTAITSAKNLYELEQVINDIKGDKKTLDLVHAVVKEPKAESEQEGEFDKRHTTFHNDTGMDKAKKLIEEINSISYVDDDDDSLTAVHRNQIPSQKKTKRTKIPKRNHRPRKTRQRKLKRKRIKRSKVVRNNKKLYERRGKRRRYGRWQRRQPKKGTKKNHIENRKVISGAKEEFINSLSKSQRKIVLHILKKAYKDKKEDATDKRKATIEHQENDSQSQDHKPQESLDSLLKNFLEQPSNSSSNATMESTRENVNTTQNSTNTRSVDKKNDSTGDEKNSSADPYASINHAVRPINFTSDKGYPAVTNPQGVPIHPNNVLDLQLGTVSAIDDNPLMQHSENETVYFDKARLKNMTHGTDETFEKGTYPQYFIKSSKPENNENEQQMNFARYVNQTEEDLATLPRKQKPSIMKHLDRFSKQMDKESAELIKPFKEVNPNSTAVDEESKSLDKPLCSRVDAVTTDGDDIFNLPSDACNNLTTTTESDDQDQKVNGTSQPGCKYHYLTLVKNDTTYKIPFLKCPNDDNENGGDDGLKEKNSDLLHHISDLIKNNSSEVSEHPKAENCEEFSLEGNNINKVKADCKKRNVTASPNIMQKEDNKDNEKAAFGTEIESQVHEESSEDQMETLKEKSKTSQNGTADVINIPKADRHEKILYKGKNLKMTQDDLGQEKIIINGSNKTIEIDYPLEDDPNGFISLKQGQRIYKLPYKNRTGASRENVLQGKPDTSWKPEYLRTKMTKTETFKVKDNIITKELYQNGAKVINMDKEKASLSIYYPPKNDVMNDTGYMVLKENGKVYNIPLDGNKPLKKIGNETYLGNNAFRNYPSQENQKFNAENVTPREETAGNPVQNIGNTATTGGGNTGQNFGSAVPNVGNAVPIPIAILDNNQLHMLTPNVVTYNTPNSIPSAASGNDLNVNTPDRDISHIKERRFKEDDFHYKPKAYQIDTSRHQKHMIESDPGGFVRYADEEGSDRQDDHAEERSRDDDENEDERHQQDFQGERRRKPEDDEVDLPYDERYHHGMSNHLVLFPTAPLRNMEEFAPREKDEEEDAVRPDDDDDAAPFMQLPEGKDDLPENNDQRQEDMDVPSDKDGLPENEEQPLDDDRRRFNDENNDNGNDGNDQRFFPLRERYPNPNKDKDRGYVKIPSLFVSGGVGLNNLNFEKSRQIENDNVMATGIHGSRQNLQVTPISLSMNPDINDRHRLEDFSTYAMGRSIKGVKSRRKKGRRRVKDMNKFLSNLISSQNGNQLLSAPSYKQMQVLRRAGKAAMKQIKYEFNQLQNDAIKHYSRQSNEKLDQSDLSNLKKLGYTEQEFSQINKQIVGHKRSSNPTAANVGIDVNGKKMGNMDLVLKTIPHVQG